MDGRTLRQALLGVTVGPQWGYWAIIAHSFRCTSFST